MKNWIILSGILFHCFCAFAQTGNDTVNASMEEVLVEPHGVAWQEDYQEALKKAAAEGKKVLIFFTGSDWCGPCKNLVTDLFEKEEFIALTEDKFVFYEANFPRWRKDLVSASQKKANEKLSSKFKVKSYPTVVIVDAKGKLKDSFKGYSLMRDTSTHYDLIKRNL